MTRGQFSWPMDNSKPMTFVAQMRLQDIPKVNGTLKLPNEGILYFFGDFARPWKVLYEQDESDLSELSPPPMPTPQPATGWRKFLPNKKSRLEHGPVYKQKFVSFQVVETYPPLESKELDALELEDDEWDEVSELSEALFKKTAKHYLFGYPSPVQGNDMEIYCQLESHGLVAGTKKTQADPRYKELMASVFDWQLLFQVDSDDDTGFMWGDAGMLYFWMRKQDAEALAFDRVWMTDQCG